MSKFVKDYATTVFDLMNARVWNSRKTYKGTVVYVDDTKDIPVFQVEWDNGVLGVVEPVYYTNLELC
ncbi:hypothetical protein ASwh1_354 [Aeromonas phage Aswh_1]|nr:hypothetical protein ASwh1_354 [Aeromonas phage Aswh_1]